MAKKTKQALRQASLCEVDLEVPPDEPVESLDDDLSIALAVPVAVVAGPGGVDGDVAEKENEVSSLSESPPSSGPLLDDSEKKSRKKYKKRSVSKGDRVIAVAAEPQMPNFSHIMRMR